MGTGSAFLVEMIGTSFLVFVIMVVTDHRNHSLVSPKLAPLFIGLAVAILIISLAPLTQCAINPARDFGPRLFVFVAGWTSSIAFFSGFWIYLLAPIVGGVLGSLIYSLIFFFPHHIEPHLRQYQVMNDTK